LTCQFPPFHRTQPPRLQSQIGFQPTNSLPFTALNSHPSTNSNLSSQMLDSPPHHLPHHFGRRLTSTVTRAIAAT
ncbi:hypothetical protein CLOM_g17897, partial [Closterium sp. NIES-68]